LWFIFRFLNVPLPFFPQYPREILLIPLVIAILLIVLSQRWARLLFYPIYALFSPLIAAYYLGKWGYSIIKIPFQATQLLASTRTAIILVAISLISWLLSFRLIDLEARAIISIFAHVSTFLLLIQLFRWASNPFRPLLALVELFSKKFSPFYEKYSIKPARNSGSTDKKNIENQLGYILKGFDFIQPSNMEHDKGIIGFATAGLVPFGISIFITIYFILAISYSVVLMNLQIAWGNQLLGLGEHPVFTDYLYFSILAQATVIPSPIAPITHLGQFLIIIPVITGILLLTLFIALFTTSIGIHGKTSINKLRNLISSERKRYLDWRKELQENSIDQALVIEGKAIPMDEKISENT
jgi:hypothetical protein